MYAKSVLKLVVSLHLQADISKPKKKLPDRSRADSRKRKQTRDTSKDAVERQRLLLEQKKGEGKSFYISMDEIELAEIESERDKMRSRPRVDPASKLLVDSHAKKILQYLNAFKVFKKHYTLRSYSFTWDFSKFTVQWNFKKVPWDF